jgi:lysophospholipase L1-like esterase
MSVRAEPEGSRHAPLSRGAVRARATAPRRWARLGVVAGALTMGVGLAGAAGAGAATAPTTTPAFYLVLGASDSLGVQPSTTAPHGVVTAHGYANDVVVQQAALGITLQLTQLGCPGESSATMISGQDRCYHNGDSQMADALAFLRSHQGDRGLVTVDLGFNDVRPCLRLGLATSACVDRRLGDLRGNLTQILTQLSQAAGPAVTFIGLNHFNPLVAASVREMRDAVNAAISQRAINRMNETLADTYASFAMPVADVAGAFSQGDLTRVHVAGVGNVPTDVARVCEYTWMCQTRPLGPNIHPNDAGYQAIASAIDAALPASWFTP